MLENYLIIHKDILPDYYEKVIEARRLVESGKVKDVSQAVKQLENTLDVSLFHRAAKGVRLTGEGELLYSYVAKGYEQIELGVKKVHQMQNMELGEVRIGASDMTLQFYLLPYLEKFHEKYPGIKVIVSNAPTPETLNSLREGRIDFGIVSTPFPDRPDIQMIPVREIEDVFVAGRRFFGYKNKMLDFQELESLPLIFLEKNKLNFILQIPK